MYFTVLQQRLLDYLKDNVKSGKWTERSLARAVGVSQPHMHHVLNGMRALSPALADHMLEKLGLTLLAFLHDTDAQALHAILGFQDIPFLDGIIGPGFLFPEGEIAACLVRLPSLQVRVHSPAIARLAPDREMQPEFWGNDFVLLERSDDSRSALDDVSLYVVRYEGEALIRRLRVRGTRLYLIAEQRGVPPYISLRGRNILDVVKAKVVWLARSVE